MEYKKGQIINNRYKVLSFLGSGGMGSTYLVDDNVENRQQVLKLLHLDDSISVDSFKQEFSILEKLNHPNLVKVFDFGSVDKKDCYYTMEFIDGLDIKKYFEKNSIEKDNFIPFYRIIIQIFLALDYIHTRKILHGDLKPENIFISKDPEGNLCAKILDFGLSESFDISKKGDFKGTAEYIAPEKIKGERIDGRSDLYSFGMIIYELLCGSLPFKYDDLLSLLKKHLYEEVQSIETEFDIPEEFKKIILRLLRKPVSNRYFSGYEVAQAVSELDKSKLPIEGKDLSECYITSSNFIGREKELGEILDLYKTYSSASRFIALCGESGIGKTRLIKEFRVRVQLDSGNFIESKCNDKIFQPYLPVLNIIKQVSSLFEEKDFLSGYKDLLGFVDLSLMGKPFDKSNPLLEKENLILSMVDFLINAGRKIPFVITVDDFHYADSGTTEFLKYFIKNLSVQRSQNIVFCVVYQSDSNSEISSILDELSSEEAVSKIELKGISKKEITKYITTSLDIEEIPEELLNLLNKDTGGNFYFIEEILKGLLDEGFLYRKQGAWHFKPGCETFKFPNSIVEIQKKRIGNLSKTDQEFLYSLSAFSQSFKRDVLDKITGMAHDEVTEKLYKFLEDEILIADKNNYSFKNQKIKDILYNDLPKERKKTLNTILVEYYKQIYYDCSDKYTELFSYHMFNAEKYDDALPLLIKAADKSKSIFANQEAEDYYTKALIAIDKVENKPLEDKIELYSKLYEVYDLVGKREMESEVIENMLMFSARLNDDKRISEVYIKQSRFFSAIGEYEKSKKSAEKAIEIKEKINDEKGKAEAYVALGSAQFKLGAIQDFLSSYNLAIEIFEKNNYKFEYANALIDMGIAYLWNLDTPEKAIEYYQKANDIFTEIKYVRGQIRAIGNIGLSYNFMGKFEESLIQYQKVLNICEKIGDKRGISTVLVNMGKLLLEQGKYSDAMEKLNTGLVFVRSVNDQYAEEAYLENLGLLYNLLGKYDNALKFYLSALEIAQRIMNKNGICGNYINIAQNYLNLDNIEESEKYISLSDEMISPSTDYMTRINRLILDVVYCHKTTVPDNWNKSIEFCKKIVSLSKENSDIDNEIWGITKLSYTHYLLNDLNIALELSLEAIRIINERDCDSMDIPEVYWNHYNILKSKKQINLGKESLKKAYQMVISKVNDIREIDLKESYLESAIPNKDIIAEYKKVFNEGSVSDPLLQNKIKNLEALYEISRTISSIHDINELLNTVMDLTLQTLNGERGMIFLLEDGNLVLKVARNVEKQSISDASEISESIIKDVVNGGKPILTLDAKGDDRFKKRLSVMNFQITSLVCVPIRLKDRILGTVYVDGSSTPKSIVAFTKVDQEFLEAFAGILAISIENARLLDRLKDENIYLRHEIQEKYKFENIIGNSPAIEKVYKIMQGAINSDGTVLIQGDSGTGKELIARAIHYNSKRKNEKFIAIDCASLHDTLLDSELFGHKKGSFTGAIADKKGLFEEASGGTIFLDEITNTNLGFQAKLLRVLQEGEIRRVGETENRFVDVRVIIAANKNIEEEIAAGRFREDLFYRLNVIPIFVPPLKERREDIPVLINHFIKKYSEKAGKIISGVSQDLVDKFIMYDWPGNIRELENIINRMIIFSEEERISSKDIPADFMRSMDKSKVRFQSNDSDNNDSKAPTMKDVEKEHILKTLEQTKGNKTEAAKLLGLKRTTLVERMKKLGLM